MGLGGFTGEEEVIRSFELCKLTKRRKKEGGGHMEREVETLDQ